MISEPTPPSSPDKPPTKRRFRPLRVLGYTVLAGVSAVICGISAENAFLNIWLPPLMNQHPERLRVDYTFAWMLIPGDVHIKNLRITNHGRSDDWVITAETATGLVDIQALRDHTFHARNLVGSGITIDLAPKERVEFEQRGVPWLIALDDIEVDDIHEIRIGDYHLYGSAAAKVTMSVKGKQMDIDGNVAIDTMRLDINNIPAATNLTGQAQIIIDSLDRELNADDELSAISGSVKIGADVSDLRFLDFYLANVPWVGLEGIGRLEIDVGVQNAALVEGSTLTADFPQLLVRVAGDNVTGSGTIKAAVGQTPEGEPQSQIAIAFDQFWIAVDGSTDALVEGEGFTIVATSPDTAFNVPFTAVNVVADLPLSTVPDVTRYNAFLPTGAGISLRSGTGSVHGHLEASSVGTKASGDLYLDGKDIRAQFDDLSITSDMAVHGRLADAQLGTGWYDLSGSTFALRRVGVYDPGYAADDGKRNWSAEIEVPSGVIYVGQPIYLDADVTLTCTNTAPFVSVFAQKKPLPPWMRGLLSVPNVRGKARVLLGDNSVDINPASISGGSFNVNMRLLRTGKHMRGEMLAGTGKLALGMGLTPDGAEFHVLGVKKWYEEADRRSGARPKRPEMPTKPVVEAEVEGKPAAEALPPIAPPEAPAPVQNE